MRRTLYTSEHEAFRDVAVGFIEREVLPNLASWDGAGLIGAGPWLAAGSAGLLGLSAPEIYGGAGMLRDFRFRNVFIEELARAGAASLAAGFALQDDIVLPYIVCLATDEQQQRWIPSLASGEVVGALAMTEPEAGSDLRGIRTSAAQVTGGWMLNGSKTFITNGIRAGLVVALVRTGEGRGSDLTLMVVEEGMAGFTRGRKLDKLGLAAQDTAELFFNDVFIPDENVLGKVGAGLSLVKEQLPLERLSIAAQAVAVSEAVLSITLDFTRGRRAFGQRISDFQASRFSLAEMRTTLDVTKAFVDDAILAWNAHDLTATDAAKTKWWASDVQNRIVDQCLQLHGGYGYMAEYPVARAFVDSRVQRIFGGTNEIMKDIIGRDLVAGRGDVAGTGKSGR